MLGVILKLLSILGLLLLVLLGILLSLLLLALFVPVTYKAQGSRKADGEATLHISANWFFSLLRVRYAYPQPGKLTVKLLCHTIFSSDVEKTEDENAEKKADKSAARKAKKEDADSKTKGSTDKEIKNEENAGGETKSGKADSEARNTDIAKEENEEKKEAEKQGTLAKKITKIKYTIRSIYDKIKEIWENIAYYADLLREEETKQLFSHVCLRLGKIWKKIRPRKLRADVLFGTDAPDTTGYIFGLYGMLSPSLGPTVNVTPDFTQKILKGKFFVSGHFTASAILANGLKVLFDKKLWRLIRKLKAGRK